MYFKFHECMRKIFNEDIDKHNILTWIIYNTNYQEEYKGLKKYQCYISSATISKCAGVQLTKVKRLLKTLENEGFISYAYKSKNQHTSSIIYANFIAKNSQKSEPADEPANEPADEPADEPVQFIDNTETQGHQKPADEPANEPADEPVSEPLSINISKNISKNISNIYIEQNEFAHDSVEEQTLKANKKEKDQLIKEQCDLLWSKYPKKKGKSKAYKKIPKLLKEYSLEELTRCVNRYSKEIQMQGIEKQFIKQGDTFFNSGYVDYLDENYEEPLKEQADNNTIQVEKFIPHYKLPGENKVGVRVNETFRKYDPDELEKLLLESQKGKFN